MPKLKDLNEVKQPENLLCTIYGINNNRVIPLEMRWEPKEDITVYELAMCVPYLSRAMVMPYEVDKSATYMRHFKIIDHNDTPDNK